MAVLKKSFQQLEPFELFKPFFRERLLKTLPIAICLLLVLVMPALAGQTFSNDDLQKYKLPADKESTGPPETFREEKDPLVEKIEEDINKADQDYWCNQGNLYREKVVKAKKGFEAAKERLRKYSSIGYGLNHKRAKRKYARAKEKLEKAKDSLLALEDRAYRQSVPATWYRCQYD